MGKKVIIDTDPGYDDMLALLYALASSPEDVEVLLISITFGNVDAQSCLRNVLSMFHVIEKEMSWRESTGRSEGFTVLKKTKPIVAVGAVESLDQQKLSADYYHGIDGLGNVHETHPHYSPPVTTWKHLFQDPQPQDSPPTVAESVTERPPSASPALFSPSSQHSVDVILSLLASHPPDTITLIAIGPLTNYATAASRDASTFLRAKDLLVMGGAVDVPGNMTPVAEFNCIADPVAAATIYALTSPKPVSTMPPPLPQQPRDSVAASVNPPHASKFPPPHLAKPLRLILFPLDITTPHILTRGESESVMSPLAKNGSPLAEWLSAILEATFQTTETLLHVDAGHQSDGSDIKRSHEGQDASLQRSDVAVILHDPLPIWYAIEAPPVSPPTPESPSLKGAGDSWRVSHGMDIRVETAGQWTRGMHVRDRRPEALLRDEFQEALLREQQQQQQQQGTTVPHAEPTETQKEQDEAAGAAEDGLPEVSGDHGHWLQRDVGNRVRVCIDTPGERVLARKMLDTIFGVGGLLKDEAEN